ncbi:tail protein X [Pseudodesulfovibrio pelocollis]|uniref:tail protein X n=1 Tax=Pseudodesulfovibrio pelocollis TaxID=3051432 RepID=UPI00255ABEEB|nr:tail protein X [Pseudodesulfovibrio sp. SB368]
MPTTDAYITSQGETPDRIALNLWGDETLFHHLVAANPDIRGLASLPGGLALAVPDLPENATEIAPPWKKDAAGRRA